MNTSGSGGGGGNGSGTARGPGTGVPPLVARKKENRRMSATGSTSTSITPNLSTNTKENKRPLSAVLSEDSPSASSISTTPCPNNQPIRQSFLSKLTRADGSKTSSNTNISTINASGSNSNLPRKDLKKISGIKGPSFASDDFSQPLQPPLTNQPACSFVYGTECDKFNNNSITAAKNANNSETSKTNADNDLRQNLTHDEQVKQFKYIITSNEHNSKESIVKPVKQQTIFEQRKPTLDFKFNPIKCDENQNDLRGDRSNDDSVDGNDNDDNDEDDDNQVIPSWPSRIDAPQRNSEFIQHKVYSLKDYSQVASPTIPPISALSTSRGSISGAATFNQTGKFQKSMSQDRKFKANAKRMSECIYSSQTGDVQTSKLFSQNFTLTSSSSSSNSHKKQQNPSQTGQPIPSASFSITSGGTLLTNTRHAVLLNESRIDRVRKLFVSPLSLRSGSKSSIGNNSASVQPRLSFQSGASMLNKPHHLMHAMYRTGATSAHLSRRSPMRQKQGKSFKVYGCPLQMANNIYPITCFGRADIYKQQSVPYILARLCNYIEENSSQLTHEGIFRVSGNARLMEKLRTLFDHLGDAPLESESVDVATSASMLKMYLRELPEPLIPTRMNYYFIALAKKYSLLLTKDNVSSYNRITTTTSAASSSTTTETSENQASCERQRLAFSRDLTKLLRKLPIENYNLLKYLACFLYRISLKQRYNKMCAEALGIVFGPNVFRIRSESYKGLKEQELSNQIMASIISNYKCIFDSEVTDPLGNIIDGDESIESEKINQMSKTKKSQHIDQLTKTNEAIMLASKGSSVSINKSTDSNTTALNLASIPIPSTSKTSDLKQISRRGHICCPRHCEEFAIDVNEGDEHEASDNDNDRLQGEKGNLESRLRADARRNEEEYDDDRDDGESYTPSSGSGSYCSSMDSETIESSFEGELGPDNAEVVVDDMVLASQSSSECASDTSYTPTSSHSDSIDDEDDDDDGDEEGAEESFYGTSSSFESSPSSNKLLESRKDGQSSCLVCKRRESAAQIGENDISTSIAQDFDTIDQKKENDALDKSKDIPIVEMGFIKDDENLSERQQEIDDQSKFETADVSTIGLQLPPAMRSRRKRDSVRKSRHPTNVNQNLVMSPTPTESSGAEINVLGGTAESLTKLDTKRAPNSSSNATKIHVASSRRAEVSSNSKIRHPTGKQAHRFDFLRRRSSSASSLNRIKHKRDQFVAATQRKASREESQRQVYHTRASRISGSDKRRLHDINKGRVGHSSTRRSRGKGQSGRKLATSTLASNCAAESCVSTSPQPYPATTSTNRTFERSGGYKNSLHIRSSHHRTNRQKSQAEFHYGNENISALNLSSQYVNPDPYLSCDFLSARYLEELDYDKYFLLRSFNSDETLLRSSSFFSEFPMERNDTPSRPRRFSGHDFQDKLNIIQFPGRPCDQIFEGFEDEVTTPTIVDEQLKRIIDMNQSHGDTGVILTHVVQPTEVLFKTSFISLLDNRLTDFRKSELSINDPTVQNQEDNILTQMKATKTLVKALKRLLKHGLTRGYSEKMAGLVQKLSEDSTSPAYVDDSSTCYVDCLSAKSLVIEITKILEAQDKRITCDSASLGQLNDILSMKITLFKQRYNDLKNIRDHYMKYHMNQIEYTQALEKGQMLSGETQGSTKKHGSLDTLRPSETSNHQQRKLSAPSQESTLDENQSATREDKDTVNEGDVSIATDNSRSRSAEIKIIQPLESKSSKETVWSRCHFGSLCPVEFVFNIEKQLASKRFLGSRLVKLNEMTTEQLQSEKLELQKNLLRYEHWFGRPVTRLEFSLVGHLYERYRAVKMIKSRKQETIEEV